VSDPVDRLPVGERAELLAILRPLLEAPPSSDRERVLAAVRLLESAEFDAAKVEGV
jgi:hypothetical protein